MSDGEGGFIKIFRKIEKWEWYDDGNTFRLFIHCLLKANYEDKRWHGHLIKRGSFITSRKKLATELKLTEQQIRTALDKLKLTNEITSEATSQFTVLTVKNYDSYQSNNQQDNQQTTSESTNEQPTDNQRATTTKKYKKEEEVQEEKKDKRVKAALDFSSWPSQPSQQVMADWVQLRKAKRAPITQTVVDQFGKELTKAVEMGISVDNCMAQVIVKGWTGFKVEWLNGQFAIPRPADVPLRLVTTSNSASFRTFTEAD